MRYALTFVLLVVAAGHLPAEDKPPYSLEKIKTFDGKAVSADISPDGKTVAMAGITKAKAPEKEDTAWFKTFTLEGKELLSLTSAGKYVSAVTFETDKAVTVWSMGVIALPEGKLQGGPIVETIEYHYDWVSKRKDASVQRQKKDAHELVTVHRAGKEAWHIRSDDWDRLGVIMPSPDETYFAVPVHRAEKRSEIHVYVLLTAKRFWVESGLPAGAEIRHLRFQADGSILFVTVGRGEKDAGTVTVWKLKKNW
jgi:hypothetical protein